MNVHYKERKIYGDFQTPLALAEKCIKRIKEFIDFEPEFIIEPTCGRGAFIIKAIEVFLNVKKICGVEINYEYFKYIDDYIKKESFSEKITLEHNDFFKVNWKESLKDYKNNILVLGNPPWVNNSTLGLISGDNLPKKNNNDKLNGLDALTGKSNFDISEWMILQYLEWLREKQGTIAILCKISVARKVLLKLWKQKSNISKAIILKINALEHFGASVDACLFIMNIGHHTHYECLVYDDIEAQIHSSIIGFKDRLILSHLQHYQEMSFLNQTETYYQWRSGVKHDCSKVMELDIDNNNLVNGFKIQLDVEDNLIYPFLKGSDIAHNKIRTVRKKVIITQKEIGKETGYIKVYFPKTWKYLNDNRQYLELRKSIIYKNRPEFSIFGIGAYSFSNYKIAISSLYKKLNFCVVEPIEGKPVMFDDTVYFLPCHSQEEAWFLSDILNSEEAYKYFKSLIFWDNKRPITIDVLKMLSIEELAKLLGRFDDYLLYTGKKHFQGMLAFG